MIILSVETSCDETSVAITKDGKEVLSNIVLSQIDIHQKFGGVVPEIASRNHVVSISRIFDEAIKAANITVSQIDLVAVTKGPGLVGSLLVGMVAATTFAYANDLPLLGVNHLYGHIYAAQIEHEIIFPALCLLVSGGHTELIYLKGHHDITILGQTLDDAVGEAYDKVARLLNIPYPGGPIVDRLASLGTPSYQLPRPYLRNEPYNFSFSGLKSAVANLINKLKQNDQEINVNDMCASFQESVTDVLVTKTKQAAADFNVKQIILAGGVAANSGLRKKMNNMITDIPVIAPSIKYCTDQAAMIGIAAYYQLKKDNLCKEYNLKVVPTLNL